MVWLRIDDMTNMNVKIRGLVDPGATGEKAKEQRCASIGHWQQLLTWVSGSGTDGFLTDDIVDLFGPASTKRRLLRTRFGRAPLMHERDADGNTPACTCLEGREWPPDFEYALHDFLDRNPSRSESDVQKAKAKELRSSTLKLAVRSRDNDTCRYCGLHCKFTDRTSDAGLTYDHVDPEVADGINNLVVACRGCNRKKGRQTPAEANMALIDLPTATPETVAGLVTTPVATPDPASFATDGGELGADLSADLRSDAGRSQTHRSPGRGGDGHDAGTQVDGSLPARLVGPAVGPPDTYRPVSRSTSPYLKQTRPFPENHAGHPAEVAELLKPVGGDPP